MTISSNGARKRSDLQPLFAGDVAHQFEPLFRNRAERLRNAAEGEIDFIASAPLTEKPFVTETVLGRRVRVETTAEILAKKVWHRGREFTARDIFDFALIAAREPGAIESIRPILRERGKIIRTRIARGEKALRTAFSGSFPPPPAFASSNRACSFSWQ